MICGSPKPNCNSNQSSLRCLIVLVRITCLPIEYFDHSFLMKVGSKLGNLIKVNNATNNVSWGHYACICVKVDLLKPLVSKFRLKRIRKLEHEGIHLVCFG